jgi:hypothetical protein
MSTQTKPERNKRPGTSRLTLGSIPAGQECPFLSVCSDGRMDCMVGHRGKDHAIDFSCALARGLDIAYMGKDLPDGN